MKRLLLNFALIASCFFNQNAALRKVESFDASLLDEVKTLPYWTILSSIVKKDAMADLFSADPKKYVLVKSKSAYAYILGTLDQDDLLAVINFLASYEDVTLICNTTYHHWFLKNGYKLSPCVELSYNPNQKSKTFPLSGNYTIKNIDASTFPQCQWYDYISSVYGSSESVLNNSFVISVFNEDQVISEAYGVCINDGFYELGIITHPGYRQQGLALAACAALIQEGLKRNLTPVWSCDCENTGSWKTALKLGFQIKKYGARLKKITQF